MVFETARPHRRQLPASTAINQLEMWQKETFDPKTIDREPGWASGIGMNTMSVYLHDLAWKADQKGCNGQQEEVTGS